MTGRVLAFVSAVLVLSGCAGYRVGDISGRDIQGVRSVYVPVVRNSSLTPDLDMTVTNAIIRRFNNDGTLTVQQNNAADSELDVTISDVERLPMRSSSTDVLVTEEYQLTIIGKATFVSRRLGKKIFENVTINGSTSFFTQADINEGERQALPLACTDLANNAVRLVTEGW